MYLPWLQRFYGGQTLQFSSRLLVKIRLTKLSPFEGENKTIDAGKSNQIWRLSFISQSTKTRQICISVDHEIPVGRVYKAPFKYSTTDEQKNIFVHKHKTRWSKHRVVYYFNTVATTLILLSGDIEINPGPEKTKKSECCPSCRKTVRCNQKKLECQQCSRVYHLKCEASNPRHITFNTWCCALCALPPLSDSFFDSENSLNDSSESEDDQDLFLQLKSQYRNNVKIGHLNTNSIAGFKFIEIKTMLLDSTFD